MDNFFEKTSTFDPESQYDLYNIDTHVYNDNFVIPMNSPDIYPHILVLIWM